MKGFLKEFKEFAMKGNVIDMAVGITIGTAFNAIVSSLVNDIIMPCIAALTSNNNFSELKLILKTTKDGTVISINYGQFIQVIIDFIIVAFSMWLVVKTINNIKRKLHKEEKEKAPVKSPELIQLEKITQILESK